MLLTNSLRIQVQHIKHIGAMLSQTSRQVFVVVAAHLMSLLWELY